MSCCSVCIQDRVSWKFSLVNFEKCLFVPTLFTRYNQLKHDFQDEWRNWRLRVAVLLHAACLLMGGASVLAGGVRWRCSLLSEALLAKHRGRYDRSFSFIHLSFRMQTEAEACGASAPITLTFNRVKSLSRTSSLASFLIVFFF